MLEQIIQITVIITFIASIVCFFVKLGEYKSLINTDIQALKDDVKELKDDVDDTKAELEKIKSDTTQVTSKLETLLIEVKTKVELLVQCSGVFDKHERPKS